MRRHRPISEARLRHALPESRVSPLAVGLQRLLGAAYARFALRLRGFDFRHPERLVEAWRDHLEGRTRLVLAFRHPYGDEPQLLAHAFASILPRTARRMGAPLPGRAWARFVHGYEVPLWSGPFVRWLLPRAGAVPVYHVKFDKPSVERILSVLRDGPHPLALAPEGQVSYRAETLPRLERGALRLGFWCAEELAAAGRPERVVVLPVSVHYRFDKGGIGALEALVARTEADVGRPRAPSPRGLDLERRGAALLERLEAVDEALIAAAERYYGAVPGKGAARTRDERLGALLEEALRRAEAAFGIRREGDSIARVYRIRQEGWDRIFPESGLAPRGSLERRLADRKAGEAWYVMRHMEFVDLCYYLDSAYPRGGPGGPSFDRLAEAAYSAADLSARLVGGNITDRPSVLDRRALVSIAAPIDLSERLPAYAKNRKAAMDSAFLELSEGYMRSIEEAMDERSGL